MEVKKSNNKLNALLTLEENMQTKWENERAFEQDAPETQNQT
jgi:hypothetical protein